MSVYPGETWQFNHNGLAYIARIEPDTDTGAPWDEIDGYMHIDRVSHDYKKKPGEVFLFKGDRRQYSYVYDVRDAVNLAVNDGWGMHASPRGENESKRAYAVRCVAHTADYLRRWCADDWCFVGVIVHRANSQGDAIGEPESVWGVESDGDYAIDDVAPELADQLRHASQATRVKRKQAHAQYLRHFFKGFNPQFAKTWRFEQWRVSRTTGRV